MNVRFALHALDRLRERFNGLVQGLVAVIEQGLFEQAAVPAAGGKWKVEGMVQGRLARIIYCEPEIGEILVVTAMWVRR